MARRRNDSVVLEDTEWSTVWRCQCGYGNTGRDRCLMCSCPAPEEIIDSPGLHAEDDFVFVPLSRDPNERAGGRATRTVAAIIGLNVVMQIVMAIAFVAGDVERATAVKVALFSGLAYYAMAALWVLARSASLGLRPWLGKETAVRGGGRGLHRRGCGRRLPRRAAPTDPRPPGARPVRRPARLPGLHRRPRPRVPRHRGGRAGGGGAGVPRLPRRVAAEEGPVGGDHPQRRWPSAWPT